MRRHPILLALFPILVWAVFAPAAFADGPVQTAVRVERGPRLDGRLDDEVWQHAAVFSDFRMVFPTTGDPTEKTELRLLYDDSNLYVGVFCYDSSPAKVCANSMAHDADEDAESDDVVKLLLDPFLDMRTAYIFYVNACGAKSEGLAFGEHASLDW
ncbi:MAG: sugar-binding protein, partial [Acidobacteriota bacterium]